MNEITQCKIMLLKGLHHLKYDDLSYASKNWLMTIPKEGHEHEWRMAQDNVKFLDDWIHELEAEAANQAPEPLSGYDFPEGGFHEDKAED